MDPLLTASATALARAIAAGEVRSREVVDAHIRRIEEVNPVLRAVVADRFEAARAEADAADAAVAAGGPLPPLHGVPCTIKESFAVRGMPWTAGLVAREGTRAPRDAVTVARLRAAGAVVLGVTNVSELCMWFESDNGVYGRSSNPYDPTRIVGGSSGGEGAIVGAGGSPFGLGADVGGSIRMPAFFCGVFGHKAGTGVVPNSGQFPLTHGEASRMLATGPIARRAEDLMPLLRVLAGPDGVDPWCTARELGDPSAVKLAGAPVVVVSGDGGRPIEAAMLAALEAAAGHLAGVGMRRVDRGFTALRRSFELWSASLGQAEGPGSFRRLMQRRRRRDLLRHLVRPTALGGQHTLPATVLGLVEDVGALGAGRVARTLAQVDRLRDELIEAIGDGVLLYPSHPRRAPRHGAPLLRPFDFAYTAVFNALGLPVTQVPMGLSEGLPVGVQVVGPPGADHRTIAVALSLEEAFGGWVPPVVVEAGKPPAGWVGSLRRALVRR